MKDLREYSYEELSNALYEKGEADGISKITDKTKWRESVMAQKLGHTVHKKISAGAGKSEYGSDAKDKNIYAEYKSKAIVETHLKNLLEKSKWKNTLFSPLSISGIYNGAYTKEAIDKYSKIDHYFGVFYKELCVLIIKVNTKYVIKTLRNGLTKGGKSTNLNTVRVNLGDTDLYNVAYKNKDWWCQNA